MRTKGDILQRVQRILAKTANNSSISETEVAMNLAHKLLRKHGLSMADVMSVEEAQANATSVDIKEVVGAEFKCSKVPKWETILVSVVNKLTDTRTLYQFFSPEGKHGLVKFVFIGTKTDVSVAVELHKYLRKNVTRLSSNHQKETRGKFRQWRSFAEGCTCSLMTRAMDETRLWNPVEKERSPFDISNFELDEEDEKLFDDEFGKETHQKYEIILAGKREKIDEYLDQKKIEKEQLSTSANLDHSSFQLGTEAGKTISLETRNLIGERGHG